MKTPLTFVVVLTLAAFAVAASSHPADVVKSRQADMKAMADAAKTLNDQFLGKRPYDLVKFKAAANAIHKKAAGLADDFTDVVEAPESAASPFIKVDRVKFDELARHLELYAAQVAAAAQRGRELPTGMRMMQREAIEGGPFAKQRSAAADISSYSSEHAFHMMLQTCTACHASFRLKR
ncbi:MAG: hypothetical protein JWM58_4289 [Rhizobium sp.]|nr:hypothetical protein [Rhizobium sp.]